MIEPNKKIYDKEDVYVTELDENFEIPDSDFSEYDERDNWARFETELIEDD
jgi:hypothetical protein